MIKNIVLDFGDIFFDLDKTATARAMQSFGLTQLTPELDLIFKTYEKGQVATTTFLAEVSTYFPKATHPDLIHAWNSILLDFPLYRLEFIEALAQEKTHRLFMLSNTNALHINEVRKKMGAENYLRFKRVFEAFYLSHEIGMRKPDRAIFEFILQQNDLVATETLFVDDTSENTHAAAKLGIKTWNLAVGQEDIIQLKSHL